MTDESTNTEEDEKAGANGGAKPASAPTLQWDDSAMSTSYANVVNVSMTREECGLFFGTNLTTGFGGSGEVSIRLTDRIIMTPHAAKRLSVLLEANLRGYEERYGKLAVKAD